MDSPSSSEDSELAAVAMEVCRQMGYPQFHPFLVSWQKWSPIRGDTPRVLASDQCVVLDDRLVLPQSMKGRLTVEEWRPLIASSLVLYYSKARRRANRIMLARILTLILFEVAAVVAGALLYPNLTTTPGPLPEPFGALMITLFVSIVALLLYTRAHVQRVIWLNSDGLACRKMGGTKTMLEVLNKIRGMHLDDVEKAEKSHFPTFSHGRPKISDRIAYLSRKAPL